MATIHGLPINTMLDTEDSEVIEIQNVVLLHLKISSSTSTRARPAAGSENRFCHVA